VPRLVARLVVDYFTYAVRLALARLVAQLVVDYFAYVARPGASARCAARRRLLRLCYVIGCLGSSRGSSSTSRRLATRLLVGQSRWLSPCARPLRFVARLLVARLHRLYSANAVHPDASSRRSTSRRSVALALAVRPVTPSRGSATHRSVAPALLAYDVHSDAPFSPLDFSSIDRTGSHRAPGHSVSRLHYSPLCCTGSTVPMTCIRMHRLRPSISRWSVALAIVVRRDNPSCITTTCLAATPARLLLRCASACLGSSLGSSSTTSPTSCDWVPQLVARLIISHFAYDVQLGASAPRAARSRPRAVLPLDFLSVGCTGSRCVPGHSASRLDYSSLGHTGSTTLMPCTQTRRLAARLLVGRLHWLPPCTLSLCLAARLLRVRSLRLRLAATLALLQPRRASQLLVSRQHRLYFEYAARRRDIVFRSHCVDHSSRLVFQTSRERQSRPQQLVRINSD
jgi:hypothetical protein